MKLFSSLFEFPKKQHIMCSLVGCFETYNGKVSDDPRKRWIINQRIGDDEEWEIVNLCPKHVREIFGLQEKDFQALEMGEGLASGKLGVGEWKNGINSLR